jgi:flavin-dependent dehydrogenase
MRCAEGVVLGAGPAGLAAALRLAALGHAVAIVERQRFPRPQIGEALTAGIHELLRHLEADEILTRIPVRAGLPALRLWEGRAPERMTAAERGLGVMVDRGAFDTELLRLAALRGIEVIQPARARRKHGRVEIEGKGARWAEAVVIDARGRAAPGPRVATGARTMASYVDDPSATAFETRIEAVPQGWLWGAPLPGGGVRTLGFCDPKLARRGPAAALSALVAEARLFEPCSPGLRVRSCDATPNVVIAEEPVTWIRAGEAAFTLDPLSSTGVERALRHGMQAAVAAHTLLRGGDPELVAAFLRARIAESVASHVRWSHEHYARVAAQGSFWHARAVPWRPDGDSPLLREIGRGLALAPASDEAVSALDVERLWAAELRVSPDASVVPVPCVVGDEVRAHPAIVHPRLDRPVAFVGGHGVVALLDEVVAARRMQPLVDAWSDRMPRSQAARVAAWMVRRGLIEVASARSGDER